jgi:septum formation protein
MLTALRGRTHQVWTALVLVDTLTGERQSLALQSEVTFFPFSRDQLDAYIDTSESLGKAGSYAVQGKARTLIADVSGDLTTVIGLPLKETAAMLENVGVPIEVDVDQVIHDSFTWIGGEEDEGEQIGEDDE